MGAGPGGCLHREPARVATLWSRAQPSSIGSSGKYCSRPLHGALAAASRLADGPGRSAGVGDSHRLGFSGRVCRVSGNAPIDRAVAGVVDGNLKKQAMSDQLRTLLARALEADDTAAV